MQILGGECVTEAELAAKVAQIESRTRSNTHRLDQLEGNVQAVNRLATSVAVMAEKQGNMAGQLEKIALDVEEMKAEPGSRWRSLTEKLIAVVATAIITFLLTRLGL